MIRALYVKDVKKVFKSLVFWMFSVCSLVFIISQFGLSFTVSGSLLTKPEKEDYEELDMDYYRNDIIKDAIGKLGYEYTKGYYITYPLGLYKEKLICDSDSLKIEGILKELTGADKDIITDWYKNNKEAVYITKLQVGGQYYNVKKYAPPSVNTLLSWDIFLEKMDMICEILGNGSYYEKRKLEERIKDVDTYEEVLANYNGLMIRDKITGAYARLMSDYLGILLAFFPVVIGVYFVHEDKKDRITEVIYTRKASSWVIIFTRYLAGLTAIMITILVIMGIHCTIVAAIYSLKGYQVDYFAFIKYSFGWLMPTAMTSLAVGFFMSELVNGILAIVVQFLWLWGSVMLSATSLVAYAGINIVPRFNAFGEYTKFNLFFNELLINRLVYVIVSILVVIMTVFVYSLKRRGIIHAGNKLSDNEE